MVVIRDQLLILIKRGSHISLTIQLQCCAVGFLRLANIVLSVLLILSYYNQLRYCDNVSCKVIYGAILLELHLAPLNLRRVRIKEAELSREEVKMKTLSLAAFVGCILAIGLAIQFDVYDGEQVNSDLRETEDLPFLRKAGG